MLKKLVEPAAMNCTLGEHSYKNDNLNDVELSKLIQLGLKGTGHDFCWSGKPIYHLQKQGNIHIFQNK